VEEVNSEERKYCDKYPWLEVWGVKKEILVQDWTDQTVTVLTCAENNCKTGLGHAKYFCPPNIFLSRKTNGALEISSLDIFLMGAPNLKLGLWRPTFNVVQFVILL
jgi:hypothetical protein